MITDNSALAAALTEAQALLSLVAEKLKTDTLAPYELFSLHVTVQVALARIDVCHDILFAAQDAPLVARAPGVVQ